MKKHSRKNHTKKNHNYKNVKENKNMSCRKMTEAENLVFTLQMQNAMGEAEHMKKIVHDDLFKNLRVLMENEGFDMSFMDDPECKPVIEALSNTAKTAIEEETLLTTDYECSLAALHFTVQLELTDEGIINNFNNDHWEARLSLFLANYQTLLAMNHRNRDMSIAALAEAATEFKKENHKAAYERAMNYLSLLVMDCPTIELTRGLASIVQAFIAEQSA